MEWRKNSVLGAASLLVIALIGAVSLSGSGIAGESSLQSNALKPIVVHSRPLAGFGFEYEFRTNQSPVPGFTKRGVIGSVFAASANGRRALRTYTTASNTNVRRYTLSGATKSYSRYIGVAGYCAASKAAGLRPLVEVKKYNFIRERNELAYVTTALSYRSLVSKGFSFNRLLCYVKPPVSAAVSTSNFKAVPIFQYVRKLGPRMYYEFRLRKYSVANYQYLGYTVVSLRKSGGQGYLPLRKYWNPRIGDSQLVTQLSKRKAGYTSFKGLLGYCSSTDRGSTTVPIYQYGRYLGTSKPIDNAYAWTLAQRRFLIRQGFKNDGVLCYARILRSTVKVPGSPVSSMKIASLYRYTKLVGSQRYFEFRPSKMVVRGYSAYRVNQLTLTTGPRPGVVPLYIFYNARIGDVQLGTSRSQAKSGYISRGILGGCFQRRLLGMVPIYKFERSLKSGAPIDHTYVFSMLQSKYLSTQGFQNKGVLCYAKVTTKAA